MLEIGLPSLALRFAQRKTGGGKGGRETGGDGGGFGSDIGVVQGAH